LLLRVIAYGAVFVSMVLIGMVVLQFVGGYRRRFIVKNEERVESLYLGIRPERLWLITLACAAAGALLVGVATGFRLVFAAAGAVVGFMAPRFYMSFMERKRRKRFDTQLLEALPMVSGAMKAGMSLMQAMERVTKEMGPPIRQEFAHALQENQVGKPIVQALHDMKHRIRSDDLSITVNAIGISQQTGGVLSDLLIKLADMIRTRNRIRGKISSLSATGRLQGIIMVFMPWVMGLAMFILEPVMMRRMFTNPLGQITLVGIGGLEFVGWLVIRKLVSIDV
jgi:tight adherence protein B